MESGDGNQVFNYKWLRINYKITNILNFQSMITILKIKGKMETRGSPLQRYIKLSHKIIIQQWRHGGRRYKIYVRGFDVRALTKCRFGGFSFIKI
jgi:hypothetical protein